MRAIFLALAAAAAGPAAVDAAEHRVAIRDTSFAPSVLSVARGDSVQFVNTGSVHHWVTSPDGLLDTGRIAPGSAARVIVPAVEFIEFHCADHLSIAGRIETD